MSVINLGNEIDFTEVVGNEGVTLVDFYADWCGPCKMLAPVLEELAKEVHAKIVKVNTEIHRNLSGAFGIQSIPTLIIFKDGKPVEKAMGFLPKPQLKKWIESHQG